MEIISQKIINDIDGKKLKRIIRGKKNPDEILLEPSQHYIDTVLVPLQQEGLIAKEKIDREQKIGKKMRDMAIKELEKEKSK